MCAEILRPCDRISSHNELGKPAFMSHRCQPPGVEPQTVRRMKPRYVTRASVRISTCGRSRTKTFEPALWCRQMPNYIRLGDFADKLNVLVRSSHTPHEIKTSWKRGLVCASDWTANATFGIAKECLMSLLEMKTMQWVRRGAAEQTCIGSIPVFHIRLKTIFPILVNQVVCGPSSVPWHTGKYLNGNEIVINRKFNHTVYASWPRTKTNV